jgi:pimeloyl-ACP methyl ester carboxylesterase
MLKADPKVGPLILLGHSEGALIAALAAPGSGADAVVSLSGSGRPLDQIIREQLKGRLPPDLEARSGQLLERLKAGQYDNDVPAPLQVIFRPSVQPYLVSLLRQDPAAAFAKVKVPALIVQGRNDIQVSVADAQALKAAKPDAQLALIDGMNHVLRIVPDNLKAQVASYNDRNLPLADALGRTVVTFITSIH